MPKQRLQVEPSLPGIGLRPAARVTDSYVRSSGAGSEAAQVASALASLSPELSRLSGVLAERSAKKNTLAGEEQARETVRQLDENRMTYAQAVKEGKIPAHQNPFMKQGYYEELGRTYAGRLQADLTAAIQMDAGLKNSVEMDDYRAFVSNFEQSWLESNVPGEIKKQPFLLGYGNRRDAILANLEAGYASQTEQRFTQRSLSMFRDEAVQFTQEAIDKEFTTAEIGDFLRIMWNDKHALGWDGQLTGRTLVDAVADVALARKDPELMKTLLESIPGGDGKSKSNTLARTGYAIEKIEETAGHIFTAKRREWERGDREKGESLKAVKASAAKLFEEAQAKGLDPDDININLLQMQAIALGDADLSHQLQTMKDAYSGDEYTDDNDMVSDFLLKLHRGPMVLKQAALDTALRTKKLSLNTYNSLSNALEEQKRSAEAKGKKAFLEDDPYHEYGEKAVSSYFGSTPDADTPDVALRRNQAKRQFSQWYVEQFLAPEAPGKGVVGMERRKMIDAMALDLQRAWVPFDPSFSGTSLLDGKDFDWKTRPVDSPERVKPVLDELSRFLSGKGTVPSPRLTSLLSIYGINPDNPEEMREFLIKQRNFSGTTKPKLNDKPD